MAATPPDDDTFTYSRREGLDPQAFADPAVMAATLQNGEFRGSESLLDPYRTFEILKINKDTGEREVISEGYVNPALHDARLKALGLFVEPAPEMHTFTIRTWIAIPKSYERPIMERLLLSENRFGWQFWTLNITGDTVTLQATKKGSVTVAVIIISIVAVIVAIAGVLAIRSWAHAIEEQQITQRAFADVQKGYAESIRAVAESDLPPDEKAAILESLTEAAKAAAPPPTDPPGGIGDAIGEITDVVKFALLAGVALQLAKR